MFVWSAARGLVMGASRNCTAVRFPLLRDGVMALAGTRVTREAGFIGGSCYSPYVRSSGSSRLRIMR